MGVLETGWGLDIILWFQSWRTPLVTSLAMVFHYLGITEFYILVLPFVYWSLDEKLGRRLGVLIALTAWVVGWAKSLFGRPRPYFISSDVSNMVEETSYGLPSGHAQGATSLAGFAAWHARRAWVTVAAVLYILLMAASRMVLGVHYPQDVASGILIALVLLALYASQSAMRGSSQAYSASSTSTDDHHPPGAVRGDLAAVAQPARAAAGPY